MRENFPFFHTVRESETKIYDLWRHFCVNSQKILCAFNVFSTKLVPILQLISRNLIQMSVNFLIDVHMYIALCAQCGNNGNSLSHILGKNFVKLKAAMLRY